MYANSITISENATTIKEYSLHMKNTNLTIHPDLYIQKIFIKCNTETPESFRSN